MTIPLALIAAAAAWAMWTYNRLITLRNQVVNAWKQIDVQLKRRHDLIPTTQQEVFPATLIATYFAFQRAELFVADEGDRAVPQVDLSLRPSR